MSGHVRATREVVIGVSPFERPDTQLVVGILRAGELGVLDLGRDPLRARAALAGLERRADSPYGVRVPAACPLGPVDLPAGATTVLLAEAGPAAMDLYLASGRRVLVEVCDVREALLAAAAGAHGLVARGSEGGGRVGEETAFVLLQRLVAAVDVPIWAAGGIGLHSAAAAVAGGAAGVLLDSQLALTRESTLPAEVRAAVAAMDGSETAVIGGHRVFVRPDLPVAKLPPGTDPVAVVTHLGADDLRTQYLPAGQDAAFARPLAARFRTVGALVRGIRAQVAEHLRDAVRLDPLAPGSPFAVAHGLRYPIAQGPMTRVSDRAEFAGAVADAGALPFLALSLMTGPETRALLEQTAERLGGKPWGAGILGFVPPEVRDAQLEAVLDVRPPVLLIAGGRPSQARPLEDAGIATYLHVPSPGLLDRFLRDGARRFVFEGRECGGHVGPRSSFALWEAQIETILASGHAGDVSVLFAGGVHDGRSAAMVSALAAPLAVRGARVGVLMGTAYLFTEEAVAAGAIMPGFQEQALSCTETVLLETAPGHATRCAATDYVRAFETERGRLTATGAGPKEMWAELEVLNLGRLRIASKGLTRQGDELVRLDDDHQRREGMFMLGQVAALRAATLTVAALHEEVSAGSSATLAALEEVTGDMTTDEPRPAATEIAIIGMACVFAGAADAETYWANVVAGADAVTEVPADRWDASLYYDADAFTKGAGRKTPSKWGGFLPDVPFDALAYGIPPRSLAAIEPVQLLSLDVASRALCDAGYGDATRELDRSRVSVVFGAEAGTDLASAYGFRALAPQYQGGLDEHLDGLLPELTEDSFPGLLTNVIAGRIANRLDLGGVNFTVDAACASSLAAVDVAVKELRAGTSDMVLCGGADLHNGINDYLLFSAVHALSPKGRCASFDAAADGIALGEGVACVVLKRLDDARRDGDRVYAVVRSVAGSSDGRSLGLTAPRPEGQRQALERAYEQARTSPAEVGLVEAHGTGTVVGDRTELGVLTELFGASGAGQGSCALGSVKSQVGHTKCAAGLAGLIKVARAVYHGVLPPTVHLEEPNPGYDPESSPFVFHTAARPWLAEERVAGVSAFGFGGTNFHAVVAGAGAEDEAPAHGVQRWPAELFVVRGADREAALETVAALRRRAGDGAPALRELAAAAAAAGDGPVQLALVARDLPELVARLDVAASLLGGPAGAGAPRTPGVFVADPSFAGPGGTTPEVAFVFPGQGSQRPGMLADLFVTFPALRHHLARDRAVAAKMLPPTAFGVEATRRQEEALTDTSIAQPALGMADLAVAQLMETFGVTPAMVAGHSYGELAALAVAGAIPEHDLVALSRARAAAILDAAGDDPGAMAAVAAPADEVRAVLGDRSGVVVANDNAPRQVVVSGPTDAVERAVEQLSAAGLGTRRINVACAFHSPVVAGAAADFAERLAAVDIAAPQVPTWSNTTAAPYPALPAAVRELLSRQLVEPVRFREEVVAMHEAGARVFVEVGPGSVLTNLVGRILGDRPHRAVAVAARAAGGNDVEALLLALAELATLGVPVDVAPLFAGRAAAVDLSAAAPAAPGWVVNGHLVRTADGALVPGALRPVTAAPPEVRAAQAGGALVPAAASADPRTAAVVEYLRGLRETVAAGRDVMLSYLGVAAPPAHAQAVPAFGTWAPEPAANGNGHAHANGRSPASGEGDHAAPAVTPLPAPAEGAAAAGTEVLTPQAVRSIVLAVVSERTGYPVEMLEGQLDLEADLSIDSIKRLEIVGELAERIGLDAAAGGEVDDTVMEQLVQLKTLDGVVAWLVAATGDAAGTSIDAGADAGGAGAGAGAPTGDEPAAVEPASGAAPARSPHPVPLHGHGHAVADANHVPAEAVDVPPASLRFVPRIVEVGPPRAVRPLSGLRVAVTEDGGGVAAALVEAARRSGAEARLVAPGHDVGGTDVFVHLAALAPGAGNRALTLFQRTKEAVSGGATTVVAVTSGGRAGAAGDGLRTPAPTNGPAADEEGAADAASRGALRFAGMRGVLKTAARELPDVSVRIVDVAPALSPQEVATVVLAELGDPGGPVEVMWDRGTRSTSTVVEEAWAPVPDPTLAVLERESVVLLTGGARGITARVAAALAQQWRCHLVLAGRSPAPEAEDPPALAGAASAVELRRTLAEQRFGTPAAIEAETRRVLAAREIRATLEAVADAGGTAEYRSFDSRDAASTRALVEAVYADRGRIDGVVHGAGVLEDARLLDKSAESFARVYGTKVEGALALAGALRPDVRFVVLFASVSGIFGNRGQVDYAAANDALADLARWLDARTAGRVVAIDWGPWAGGGMVSPELEREFARRGVGLLEERDGVERLLDEIRSSAREPEVVVMRARPERFGASAAGGNAPASAHSAPALPADARRGNALPARVDGPLVVDG